MTINWIIFLSDNLIEWQVKEINEQVNLARNTPYRIKDPKSDCLSCWHLACTSSESRGPSRVVGVTADILNSIFLWTRRFWLNTLPLQVGWVMVAFVHEFFLCLMNNPYIYMRGTNKHVHIWMVNFRCCLGGFHVGCRDFSLCHECLVTMNSMVNEAVFLLFLGPRVYVAFAITLQCLNYLRAYIVHEIYRV